MIITTGEKINKYRIIDTRDRSLKFSPVGFKGKFLDFLQTIFTSLRDDGYYNYRILKKNDELRLKIIRDTNWLSITTNQGNKRQNLPFHEQAIKYFEYKNMIIQRRSQYVIICLTISLLLMTALEIYLKFFIE